MTEEEAKTKSCCGPPPCGRLTAPDHPNSARRCIGSACMAWRETEGTSGIVEINAPEGHGRFGKTLTVNRDIAAAKGWPIVRDVEPHGYCGLAGKP